MGKIGGSKVEIKKVLAVVLTVAAAVCSGCRVQDVSGEERKKVDYTVVKVADMPEKVIAAVQEHQKTPFQLTFESGEELYIMQGFGKQKTGGYSIQIQEVSASEDAVYVKTELIAPKTKEKQKGEGSCPYMVIKTENKNLPVLFEGI